MYENAVHILLIHVCTTQHVLGRAARLCKEQVFTIRSYQQAPVTTSVEIRKYARDYLTEILGTVTICSFVIPAHITGNFLSRLGSKAELGWAGHVEDDELRLEEDVAVNGEANACIGLDTTEAGCEVSLVTVVHEQWEGGLTGATNRRIVDVSAWHHGFVGSNAEGDARESSSAGEDITALRAAVFRAGYFGVVCGDCS